jgi:hypothetical protein
VLQPMDGTVFTTLLLLIKICNTMRSILYLIAVILVVGWIFGFFVSHAGGLIHILLVLAVISLLLGLIRRGTVD